MHFNPPCDSFGTHVHADFYTRILFKTITAFHMFNNKCCRLVPKELLLGLELILEVRCTLVPKELQSVLNCIRENRKIFVPKELPVESMCRLP